MFFHPTDAFSRTLVRTEKSVSSNIFDETIDLILALNVAFLPNRLNKASSNRRVSTVLKSVRVNMSLLISEILPRGLVFFPVEKLEQ